MGAAVGDPVQLVGGMGSVRQVFVQSVTTAHRRLLALAQETWTRSLQAPKHLVEVSLPALPDGVDFSQMHAMLKERSAQSERAFAAYRDNPLTLGLLGQLLGATAVDLVSSWPSDGPALHVCSGRADEFEAAATACAREHAQFVVDAATLVELVNLRMAPVLGKLPKVLVTTETLNVLEARLEDARTDRASGRAVDMGGRMSFIESTAARKTQATRFFEEVLGAVRDYCEVVPAYGPEEIPAEFRRLSDLLPREERAVLLLGAERAGVLLTLDGRLAALAGQHLNLVRVWPQALLAHAHEQGWISADAYSFACARTFVLKRSFTSMRAVDLLLMCQQGPFMLRRGLEVFKQHLSSPDINFQSISKVCLEFLEVLATQGLSVAAYGEVVSHLCEAIAQRPFAEREELLGEVRGLVRELVGNSEAEEVYPPLAELRRQVLRAKLARVEEMIQTGVAAANEGHKHRPVRLNCVMCTPVPRIIFTRQEAEEPPTTPPVGQAGSGEPKDGEAATTSRAYLMSPPSNAGATAPQEQRASHTPVQVPHVDVAQTVGPPPSV